MTSQHLENHEEDSLDNWKPSPKKQELIKSQWREEQNNGNYNVKPGSDELKKIKRYLNLKYPDHQIMDAFGINCETLLAIKRDCYTPINGISLDSHAKIVKEFERIDKKMESFSNAFKFLIDNLFEGADSSKRIMFKSLIGYREKNKKKKVCDEEE